MKKNIEELLSKYYAKELKSNTKEYSLAYYYAHREKRLSRDRELYKNKSVEEKRKKNRQDPDYYIEWRKNNPEYMSKYMKRRRKENPGLVRTEERQKEFTRKQLLLKLTKLFIQELDEIYLNCPENHVVDHIIPLQGKNVTGLNVPWNMQYLTKSENNFKRNSFDNTYNNDSWKIRYNKHY